MMYKELISDNRFQGGFALQGPDAVNDQRKVFSHLDYGGEAIGARKKIWIMSQWWTPFDFKDAEFKKLGRGLYEYRNESRHCHIDTGRGSFRFALDSNKEYQALYGGNRTDKSRPWSHFLLEQDFVESARLKDLKALYANLSFSIDKVENHDKEFDPNMHTAQFIWYLTIREGVGDSKEPLGGNFIWLGIPMYDYRYPYIGKSVHFDGDFAGSTRALIYSLDSRDYLEDVPLKLGKEYNISFDILPLAKKAVRYAVRNGIFATSANLVFNYMNIGWELPGSFDVESTIKGLSLKGVYGD